MSAVFLSGRPFPAWEETTLQVGGRSLWQIVAELAGKSPRRTDGGLPAAGRSGGGRGRGAAGARRVRALGVAAKSRRCVSARLRGREGRRRRRRWCASLLSRASPLEAKYIVKIMTGDLRIGLKESLVEEAIARAYGGTLGGGAARQHAAGRYRGDGAAGGCGASWRRRGCGCFIRWGSCWRVRWSRRKRG